jgi:hypothetical protein
VRKPRRPKAFSASKLSSCSTGPATKTSGRSLEKDLCPLAS